MKLFLKSSKLYIPIMFFAFMFGAVIYITMYSDSWKFLAGTGLLMLFFVVKSGQNLSFWLKGVSVSTLQMGKPIGESIIRELNDAATSEREIKRNTLLGILYFHRVLFRLVCALLLVLLLGSIYFQIYESDYILRGMTGVSKSVALSSFTIFILLGIWWWCRKTYPPALRNDIDLHYRLLSRNDWDQNLIFNKIVAKDTSESTVTFDFYWLHQGLSVDDVILLINREQIYFERHDGKWMLVQGARGNSEKKNLAGFVKALIELKYLKASLCKLEENAQHLKEVFYIKALPSKKELQEFHGQNFQNLNREYVEFFKEKLKEISTQSTLN